MNKKKKIIFFIILLTCPIGLIIKDKLLSKQDLYVLTKDKNVSEEVVEEKGVEKEENNITNKVITVYISGEVNKPGIVTLSDGDRLATAVEKVGGTTKKADLNGVNMAVKLKDEMHYIIPRIGEIVRENNSTLETNNNINQGEVLKTSQININTATIEELDKLPGVGEATANKIVNHRSENGQFENIEAIKNVNGIGDKKFEEMKDLICVK